MRGRAPRRCCRCSAPPSPTRGSAGTAPSSPPSLSTSRGTKASYLGVQKRPPSLALCPATNNCVSTSERISNSNHYAPPW
uniref:Uncharacterized protein n=1 Tax=Triticum aestivum TaxID=4565 RepID=A0A077S7F8_WHEAT|nr:unnamed protein product [Triticum aestivum]